MQLWKLRSLMISHLQAEDPGKLVVSEFKCLRTRGDDGVVPVKGRKRPMSQLKQQQSARKKQNSPFLCFLFYSGPQQMIMSTYTEKDNLLYWVHQFKC